MATNNQKSVEIIEGEVTQAFAPAKNDAGAWRPANIYIETAEGKVKISEFPKSNYDTRTTYEPIQMPAWYVSLGDVAHLVGVQVQVIAEYKSTYEGTREYNKIQTFKVLGSLPTPQPSESPATALPSASWTASLDERIAWNSAINNAVNAHTIVTIDIEDEVLHVRKASHDTIGWDVWLGMVDALANQIYPVIRRGPTPPAEDAPEQPVEAPDPNLEPEPDIDYPGVEDTASNMGVMEV
jgi:hypothetical protein